MYVYICRLDLIQSKMSQILRWPIMQLLQREKKPTLDSMLHSLHYCIMNPVIKD